MLSIACAGLHSVHDELREKMHKAKLLVNCIALGVVNQLGLTVGFVFRGEGVSRRSCGQLLPTVLRHHENLF